MFVPGYYEMNYGGMTLGECRRLGGTAFGFVVAVTFKLSRKRGDRIWLPACDSETPCDPASLSEDCRRALEPEVARLRTHGFSRGAFVSANRDRLVATTRDAGGYRAIHDDGSRIIFVAYIHTVVAVGSREIETRKVVPTGEIYFPDGSTLGIVGGSAFFDTGPGHRRIFLPDGDLDAIAKRLESVIASSPVRPRIFTDLGEFDDAHRAADEAIWEARISRGLYRLVGLGVRDRD